MWLAEFVREEDGESAGRFDGGVSVLEGYMRMNT